MIIFYFFFSSRRRHTRSYGDWSSDVCSSDLGASCMIRNGDTDRVEVAAWLTKKSVAHSPHRCLQTARAGPPLGGSSSPRLRSEERRVGKECRSRGSADDEKQKRENNVDIYSL